MGSKTDFLQLSLLDTGAQRDTWGETLNANFQKIDDNSQSSTEEIVAARFNAVSLDAFLAVAHEVDGTLKPAGEVVKARSSMLYGDEDVADFDLAKRLDMGDMEVFRAMEGSSSLRTSIARSSYMQNTILSGSKDVNGYPTWLGFTGANVQVDGEVPNILMLIDGQKARARVLEQITLSGAAGIKYLFATFNANGLTRVTGTSTGTTGTDFSTKVRILQDLSVDFTTEDVKPYDVLVIATGANAGTYLIAEVAPSANNNQLRIFGKFPGGSLSNISYTINDPLAVTLGFDAVKTPVAGKLYIGEADFDGAAVTAVRALHFEDVYVGAWQTIDVIGTPLFNLVWNHNLFDTRLDVEIQASTANDDSQPVVPMMIGGITNALVLNLINSGLLFSPGVWSPGLSGADYNPLPSLTGIVTAEMAGDIYLDNAVRVQFTKTQIQVKNPFSGVFFKNYAGAAQTVGYVRVIVRRKA